MEYESRDAVEKGGDHVALADAEGEQGVGVAVHFGVVHCRRCSPCQAISAGLFGK